MSIKTVDIPKVTPPPGIELHFCHSFPDTSTSPFEALVVAVHWSATHTTNLRLTTPDGTYTESLPKDWPAKIDNSILNLDYKNPETGNTKRIRIQEMVPHNLAAVMSMEMEEGNDTPKDGKIKVITMELDEYVNVKAVKERDRSVANVFKVDELWNLCDVVKDKLLDEEMDVRKVKGVDKSVPSPYASKLTKEQEEKLVRDREEKRKRIQEEARRSFQPRYPTFPNRGIGSSDLDPFGPLHPDGGMLMDPRGFRRPNLPQGIVPGARFDPIGPGGLGPRVPFRGGGAPRLPFGMPDHDHLPPQNYPHGYDDMFS